MVRNNQREKMKKDRAIKLKELSLQIAENFSRKDREYNFNSETFTVDEIIPTSENTATITFLKNTGKRGLAFCYWINMAGGQWKYFFPTYDHCVGMKMVEDALHGIEITNFGFNFEKKG